MSGLKKDMGAIQKAIQMLAGTYNQDMLTFELATVTAVDTSNWQCTATLVSGDKPTEYKNIQLTSEIASNGFVLLPKVGSNVILAITWRNEIYVFMCSEVDALVFHQANNDSNKTFGEFVICNNPDSSLNLPLGIQLTDGGGNGIVINSGTGSATNSIGNNGIVISSGTGSVSNDSNGIVITNSNSPPSNKGNGVLVSCGGTMQFNDGSLGGLVKVIDLTTKLNNLENKVNDLVNAWSSFAGSYAPGTPTSTGTPATATNVSGTLTTTQQSDIENADIKHGPKVS